MIDYESVTAEEFEKLADSQRALVPMSRKLELLNEGGGAEEVENPDTVGALTDEEFALRMHGYNPLKPESEERARILMAKGKRGRKAADDRSFVKREL